ncbi:hypothetical protein RB601_002066 [Gaeumannomyces tritici]
MAALQRELDEWRSTVPYPPSRWPSQCAATWMYDPESVHHDSRDFFELQYHKSVLLLYTVLLPTLDPTDPRFGTTATSVAAVCTAYKRLEQHRTLSYTMLALHSCFVAGLTLVYCSWRGGRRAFSFEALDAARACSQSLTIFGEKWPGAVKYRDIFDALSGSPPRAMMAHGGDEAPLVPLSGLKETSGDALGGRHLSTNHMVSDAVADAFMEVDEEAPGWWHCWRMLNEMVQPEGSIRQGASADNQNHEPQIMSTSEWDFGGLEGLG